MMQINNAQPPARILVAGVALLLVLVGGGGCLISSDTQQRRTGNYVADSTFAQIKPHQTTAGWVRATMGDPTRVTRLEDGAEVWDYAYSERKESSGAVFLIFGGHDVKEITGHAFVEVKDGVVTHSWRG